MDNLVDGVENFAAAHPTITHVLFLFIAGVVFGLMLRVSMAAASMMADAMKDQPLERVFFLIVCLALAGMAWVNSSTQHARIEDQIRDLSHDIDRITWKLDERACREAP